MRTKLGLVLLAAGIVAGVFAATAPATWAGNTSGVTITKVVSGSNATNAGGSVTYTITVTNNSGSSISLDCVTDTFPAGFTWDSNSGGFNPGDYNSYPQGCADGWFFDGENIATGNSLSWSFIADVDPEEPIGCYFNDAMALWDESSADTGQTAPVAVGEVGEPCGQQAPTQPAVVRSATPTRTATPAATDTELAAPPTNTPVPAASPTAVGGGVGAGITGPNTGTGGGAAGGHVRALLLALAAALALAGGGIVLAGRRRA